MSASATTAQTVVAGTIYFITGANRGLGLAFVTHILKNNHTAFVYAAVRDPVAANYLQDLERTYSNRLAIVKYTAADEANNQSIAKEIERRHGRVDTVIVNAGIADSKTRVVDTPLKEIEDHMKVNFYAPIVIFHSMYQLLKKSKSTPRFITISSVSGSLDGIVITLPTQISYGTSKAALNWATRKIHFENEWLVAFPLSPGIVETEMYRDVTSALVTESDTFKAWLAAATIPKAADVAKNLLDIIDNSTRENEGGQFVDVDGSRPNWIEAVMKGRGQCFPKTFKAF